MTLFAAQTVVITGTTPTSNTTTTSDTVSANDILAYGGAVARFVTTGTAATLTLVDASKSPSGSPATNPTVALPGTGTRYVLLPAGFINPANNTLNYTLSVATGISVEIVNW